MSTLTSVALRRPEPIGPRAKRRHALRRLGGNRASLAAFIVLVAIILTALLPADLLPHDPTIGTLSRRFQPPGWISEGSWEYPLGTDALGRDVLSRLMYGGRYTLLITFTSVPIAAVAGTTLGILAGYHGGRLDSIIMRVADVQLAFPTILLMIAIIGSIGASVWSLVGVLALAGWVRYSRLIRGSVLALREREFVESSRATGATTARTIVRHILPNVASPLVVLLTFELARTLLLESTLSFLGVGVQPPEASWGTMIADGRNYLVDSWWVSLMPGALIVITVLAFNFLGDGLRDVLDPTFQDRQ